MVQRQVLKSRVRRSESLNLKIHKEFSKRHGSVQKKLAIFKMVEELPNPNYTTETMWSYTTLIPNSHGGVKDVVILDDFIFLLALEEGKYDCYYFDQKTQNLKVKYSIPVTRNWKTWEMAYPTDQPLDMSRLQNLPTLFTIENPGHTFRAYNLDTGKQFYQQLLDAEIKYDTIDVVQEQNQVILASVKASLPGDLMFDSITITITGLQPITRWQVQFQNHFVIITVTKE